MCKPVLDTGDTTMNKEQPCALPAGLCSLAKEGNKHLNKNEKC